MKKIMFSDKYCLTQAVLNGSKTMTRRSFARFEPDARMFDEICNVEGGFDDKGRWIFTLYNKDGDIIGDMIPRYNVGEVVAIAQSYKSIADERDEAETALDLYKIGDNFLTMDEMAAGWNNKMLVKADLMPHHIRITDVKIELLQDILEKDCLREGIGYHSDRDDVWSDDSLWGYYGYNKHKYELFTFDTPHEAFTSLIDKIMGKGTWESNPWVAAYSFELVD